MFSSPVCRHGHRPGSPKQMIPGITSPPTHHHHHCYSLERGKGEAGCYPGQTEMEVLILVGVSNLGGGPSVPCVRSHDYRRALKYNLCARLNL